MLQRALGYTQAPGQETGDISGPAEVIGGKRIKLGALERGLTLLKTGDAGLV